MIRILGVSKSYGAVQAVKDASLEIELGRVHAIVGENGAGKSTLLKMAAGIVVPSAGHVEISGARLEPHTPASAIRAGVGMVAQHFSLVPPLTALENIMLGFEPGAVLNRAKAYERARAVMKELDVEIDLDASVSSLDVGDKQRLEIARVLFREAKAIILDEPTAVLAPQEADALYSMLARLAKSNRAIAVVTHKLDEVYAHADVVTVMRRGAIVSTHPVDRAREDFVRELAREVMGGDPPALAQKQHTPGGDALVVDALVVPPRLRGATLRVRTGEIVGVCGIEGSGQDELVRAIAGLTTPLAGRVRMPSTQRPAVVFADRQREGLVLDASIEDNAILGEHGALTDRRTEAKARMDRAGVSADLDVPVRALSGGNQQKIVVERACSRADGKKTRLLVLAHPTRGVDIGAARAIHERILETAARGVGVLVLGSDIDELRAISDRLLVLARGRIAGEVAKDAPAARIGELMLAGQG